MSYFVKIQDAKDLRRKVLESSKGAIHTLKGYQQLLEIRGRKHSLMNDARRELKEITVLINKIEELMPTLSKRELDELGAAQLLPMMPEPKAKPTKRARKQARSAVVERLEAQDGPKVYIGQPEKPKEKPAPAPELPVAPAPKVEEVKEESRKESELDRLQRQLRDIDTRLGKL